MLMQNMLRVVWLVSVFSFVLLTSTYAVAQTCASHSFSNNKVFATCRDLPELTSYLHWTYDQNTAKLDIAFRHDGIKSTDSWVAWGINPRNVLDPAMIGAQALVAILQSNGTTRVYTSSIASTSTQLQDGTISYDVTGLRATYQNNEVTIFATLTLPNGTTSLVHLWQDGALSSSSIPQQHYQNPTHLSSKETLDLLSGQTQPSSTANSRQTRRNTHGVINALSWGILMPTGAIIARYLKVFKSADPAWFYLHIMCQASAYVVGVAGFGTGLKLGSDSVGVEYDTHRSLGIVLFCLGTLQVFALFLRPNKDHKHRLYWNVYHHAVGYATIIISIINVFEGFNTLENYVGDRYNRWKHAYIGIIGALGGIAVFLEAYTWIIVFKRRQSENKMPESINGANGHDSRPQHV
ncbi:PREDICTED: cytochrome b561 and DOMON domain-containing protein At5g47530-like [Lupinus angustifolius]|uniref:cytochrome b561 and DOMON domain-containing protein At5g47530-like n=1 Tax=Lupinus angustifolius TaxID=3871 RepID=UPI00092EAA85|nr:PREDICTED: cytochrome b561 and DOMON domain-containing protein At5g47530-like [Lupinus angustifolius]XP_019464277.1 PREDICTED: cytochrome b561 and DOMON domain-containing protein At5g47530-like [Lupinus angustifolius]